MVTGAGQAGLSAAYHLQRRGFLPAGQTAGPAVVQDSPGSYVVLDAEGGPGGAWRHRWQSLRMATVNGISDLPGIPQPEVDPAEPSSRFLARYFGDYEDELRLNIVRPVKVLSVSREDGTPSGRLRIETSAGTWSAQAVISATGTWTRPFWPIYPGRSSFQGRQLHVADYVAAEEFRGKHVIVVGGGISAVGLIDEISQVTTTSWFTRREPVWRDAGFDGKAGHDAVALVEERVRQGLPPQSVVSATGLIWTPSLRAAAARGALERHAMFTAVAADERIHLVGYGPSSSTIGANRAGRAAVAGIVKMLGRRRPGQVPTTSAGAVSR
ncbi:NAD(P)-binding domain-containing protein [Arthrobacter sp. NPDC058288]|uniref:NAD(P)-binding domain-containing protein n=1 Tax=Arthrobacter sp. NPDC058288 TaxID=3346424 RepID=UPI0036EEB9E4